MLNESSRCMRERDLTGLCDLLHDKARIHAVAVIEGKPRKVALTRTEYLAGVAGALKNATVPSYAMRIERIVLESSRKWVVECGCIWLYRVDGVDHPNQSTEIVTIERSAGATLVTDIRLKGHRDG